MKSVRLVCLLACLFAQGAQALDDPYDDIVDYLGDRLFTMCDGADSLQIPYYCSVDSVADPADFTRLVVSLHGTLRNADNYYLDMYSAAELADSAQKRALIVAPQFLVEGDIEEHDLPATVPFWEYMGWRQGDPSLDTAEHPRPWTISSFAVMDSLLRRFVEDFPTLESVVIAGHSAGGQFVNRYAAGSDVETWLQAEHGVAVRYIVANPSSYMYFDTARWLPGTPYELGEVDPGFCATFNDYKYGLDARNAYMSQPESVLRDRYAARDVIYLLGERDDDHYSSWLDRTCPALLQGTHRLQRGILYFEHLKNTFGGQIEANHERVIVPGIGHSHNGIFRSRCGLFHIFDFGVDDPLPLSANWAEVSTPDCVYRAGTRAAWVDHDLDGWPDLYLTSTSQHNLLLMNDRDATFHELQLAPLDDADASVGARAVDYDGDGDLDIALLNTTGGRLFRREGAGYVDATTAVWEGDPDFLDMDWVDYDNDGDLDCYLCKGPDMANVLLVNSGGVFERAEGLAILTEAPTLCAAWADYDLDGDADVYLGISGDTNRLYRNDGGVFTEVACPGTGAEHDTGAASWGDYDNDGDPDLYLGNGEGDNRLRRNDGDGQFTDVTTTLLANAGAYCHSTLWQDFDNDGRLDLFLSNSGGDGKLLRNLGDGAFAELEGYPLTNMATAAAAGDIDRDGDSDLYLTYSLYANALMLNTLDDGSHWLQVGLLGEPPNTGGIGARVELIAGGLAQSRQVGLSDSGPFTQTPPYAAFGLGSAAVVDTLRIFWPSGVFHEFTDLAADRFMRVSEATGLTAVAEAPPAAGGVRMLPCSPNPFNPSTTISFVLPEAMAVTLTIHDARGRRVDGLLENEYLPRGLRRVVWSGRDDRGRPVASGVYIASLVTPEGAASSRLLLLK